MNWLLTILSLVGSVAKGLVVYLSSRNKNKAGARKKAYFNWRKDYAKRKAFRDAAANKRAAIVRNASKRVPKKD